MPAIASCSRFAYAQILRVVAFPVWIMSDQPIKEKRAPSENINDVEVEGSIRIGTQKTTKDGILLVPQPSDDPQQPLVRYLTKYPKLD